MLCRALQKLPNVEHRWGSGPLAAAEQPVVAVFRHRLLQQFMLSIFSKLPVQPVTRMRDLRCAPGLPPYLPTRHRCLEVHLADEPPHTTTAECRDVAFMPFILAWRAIQCVVGRG